jgi:diazepam-binding inhibitor (GABA receptor modulating acyl-CoA-binding protein)
VQLEARAKWDAWNSVKGMAKEEAQRQYAAFLTSQDPSWESQPCLANFKDEPL